MQENKKKMISLSLTLVALLLVVVGATYAYFAAQLGTGASTDVNITAESVDSLTFTTGGPIRFSITQENFKSGGENKKGSTTSTASLIAGKDLNASYTYYVYLDIKTNEFIYTTDEQTPEVVLKVIDPNNNAITNIEGLIYNETLGGFDITTFNDIIKIASDYQIETTTNVEQTWKIEVEVINLETNQVDNAGKKFAAELLIQKEKLAETIADVCNTGDNLAGCVKSLNDKSVYHISSVVHHNGENEYDANDDSYRYSGPNYKVINAYQNNYTTVYNMIAHASTGYYLRYYKIGDSNREYYPTLQEAIDRGVQDKSIVEKVNNYVCFGSDANPCPADNLYRIIGVFNNQIKLIKSEFSTSSILGTDGAYEASGLTVSDYYGNLDYNLISRYTFNTANNGSNDWATSLLNTTNLNTNYINYLNNINTKWENMIESANWNIGGSSNSRISPREFYALEKAKQTESKYKIGLMNLSDYAFAADPYLWQSMIVTLHNYYSANDNWLYTSQYEWTLTPATQYTDRGYIFILTNTGISEYAGTAAANIRPTFYLKNNVKYEGGEGTYHSPYQISI